MRVDYRTALADYYTIINQCRNMIANNRTGLNTEYMDILDSELPKKDLDGGSISYSSNFRLNDLERGDEVSEDYIANVRYMFRMQYFLYKRKKSRWMTLYAKVNMLIEHPITYEPDYLIKGLDDAASTVYPSGDARATASAATTPPPPARFSITTDCPRSFDINVANARMTASPPVPAGYSTITRIGLLG